MKLAGTRSWRFAVEVSDLLHLALRVRDGAALEVPTGPDVPPELLDPPVPRDPAETVGAGADPAAAGTQWLPWWRELVELESRRQLLRPDQVRQPWGTVTRRLRTELAAAADPPRFDALSQRPALQTAARAVGPAPRRSIDRQLRQARGWRDVIDWPVVNRAVHSVAEETSTNVNELNGCALVLLVRGSWWQPVGPGAVLCSLAAAADPDTAAELVRAAVRSGL